MDVDMSDSNATNEDCNTNTQRLIAESGGRCMSTQAMQSLYDFRQNNLLCDAVLRLEDGGVFPIHRAILSACSTYFRSEMDNGSCQFEFVRMIIIELGLSNLLHNFIAEHCSLRHCTRVKRPTYFCRV